MVDVVGGVKVATHLPSIEHGKGEVNNAKQAADFGGKARTHIMLRHLWTLDISAQIKGRVTYD